MCTIVTMAKNGVVLAGNNEDYTEPRTKTWFIPASKEAYGRVYVGFDHAPICMYAHEHQACTSLRIPLIMFLLIYKSSIHVRL